MYVALLIIGIVITSIAIVSITVFSISNFIISKINKEQQEEKTDAERRKEKLFKRSLKWLKRVLKLINKKLLENLWAFYGIATVSVVGGISMVVVGAVQEEAHKQELVEISSSNLSSSYEKISSSDEPSSVLVVSSTSTFSSLIESSSAEQISSQAISSSDVLSSSFASSSNTESSSVVYSSSVELSSSMESSSELDDSSSIFIQSYTVKYVIDCEYDESYSERSYPYELVVAESSFAEDYEEHGLSVTHPENIKWYKDSGHTEEFDFSTPITEDVTLYGYYYEP